jgi:predicted histidine transporter YuiF (NhaC family)
MVQFPGEYHLSADKKPKTQWEVWAEKADAIWKISKAISVLAGALISLFVFYEKLQEVITQTAQNTKAIEDMREENNENLKLICKRLKIECVTYKRTIGR